MLVISCGNIELRKNINVVMPMCKQHYKRPKFSIVIDVNNVKETH